MTTAPDPEMMSAAAGPREAARPVRVYRYYDLVMAAFVTVLLCANVIGAAKRAQLFGFTFGAGVPSSRSAAASATSSPRCTDTRARARWSGRASPPRLRLVHELGHPAVPARSRLVPPGRVRDGVRRDPAHRALASLVAYFCGEFCNSFVLAKMKIWSSGRNLWMRTIGSTIAGELVDSLVFYPLAFLGIWTTEQVLEVLLTNYALKVGWEAVMTPFTYRIVNFLKGRARGLLRPQHRLHAVRSGPDDSHRMADPFPPGPPHRSAAHEEPDLRGSAPGAPGAVVPVRAAPREAARGRRARHRRQARGVRALLRGFHFLAVREIVRAVGPARAAHDRGPRLRNRGRGSGLGPGGGRRHARGGIDRSGWAVEEARGPSPGSACAARRGAATCWAARCPAREPGSSARTPRTTFPEETRAALLDRLLDAGRRGARVLVVEPIARGVTPWWAAWAETFAQAGGRSDERFPAALPPRLALLDRAASLDHRELTARSLWL